MGNLGFTELLFIFILALIFFGPRKLPELGKALGETLGQFKRASEDFKRSWEEEVEIEKKRVMDPVVPKIVPAPNAVATGSAADPAEPVVAPETPAGETVQTERTA